MTEIVAAFALVIMGIATLKFVDWLFDTLGAPVILGALLVLSTIAWLSLH